MAAKKTLPPTWQEKLSQAWKNSRRPALVGVGQELRGDDAAGLLIIRRLKLRWNAPPEIPLIFEAGPLPESATGPLRRYQPDLVIFVDAADMGEPHGTIAWLEEAQLSGISAFSHVLPLNVLFSYLQSELGCLTVILGIQPGSLDFDSSPTEPVLAAMGEIIKTIIELSSKK